jgi:erlin
LFSCGFSLSSKAEYDRPWIFDKIHHEVNQLCSQHTLQEVYIDLFHTVDDILLNALQESCDIWAPGIEVVSIRVTKPRIPESIRKNYEAMEAEKTKLMVSTQAQKVAEKEAETDKMRATVEAEKQREVAAIDSKKQLAQEQAEAEVKKLKDQAMLHHEKALADAEFYQKSKLAEANDRLFSDNYLKLEAVRSFANTTKIYFGPSVQNMFLDVVQGLLGDGLSSAKSLPAKK